MTITGRNTSRTLAVIQAEHRESNGLIGISLESRSTGVVEVHYIRQAKESADIMSDTKASGLRRA